LLSHQAELLPIELPAAVEKAAQRIAAQLIEQRAVVIKTPIADEGHSPIRIKLSHLPYQFYLYLLVFIRLSCIVCQI